MSKESKEPIIPDKSLVMLVGVPGVGKSTLAQKAFEHNSVIISSDAIRAELYGSEECQQDPQKVFEIFFQRIHDELKKGKRVIADATNIRKDSREEMYDIAKKLNVPVYALVFVAPLNTILEQNKKRERQVPDYVIIREYKRVFGIKDLSEQEYFYDKTTGKRLPKYPLEAESQYNQISNELPKGHVIDITIGNPISKNNIEH